MIAAHIFLCCCNIEKNRYWEKDINICNSENIVRQPSCLPYQKQKKVDEMLQQFMNIKQFIFKQVNPPTPFRCSNTFTIIKNKLFSPTSQDGRKGEQGGEYGSFLE